MSIRAFEQAKFLRGAGRDLGRQGLAEFVIGAVAGFDGSYKGAMKLAGTLYAVAIAARYDDYWTEKVQDGYYAALSQLEWEAKQAREAREAAKQETEKQSDAM